VTRRAGPVVALRDGKYPAEPVFECEFNVRLDMLPLPELGGNGYLLSVPIALAAVLAPLAVGGLAGTYAMSAFTRGAGYEPSSLLSLWPTLVAAWLLLTLFYLVPVSVIGSVLGGYLAHRSSPRSA
jgi:hypothetical protein